MANGTVLRSRRRWLSIPKPIPCEDAVRRAKSASCSPISRTSPTPRSATRSPTPVRRHGAAPRLPGDRSRWSSPGSIPWKATHTASCATRLEKLRLNDSSPSTLSRKVRLRLASVSAAASSACCTWKSSRNGWSASSTSTSSPPPRASATRSRPEDRRNDRGRQPRQVARPIGIEKIEEPIIEATVITPRRVRRRHPEAAAKKSAASKRSSSTSAAAASCWSTRCRSTRWFSISTTG